MKATNLINPNQNGMEFLTVETHTIDIVLASTLAIDSITFHSLSNIDSFIIQLHHSHRYYLEITSNIGSKSINKLGNVQANLIRIIILGTEDGFPPNHISLKIAACVPTRLPKIMASPFKNGSLDPISKDSFPSPSSVEISATVDVQLIQEPQIQILPSPILVAPIIEYVPSINLQPQYVENQIPVNVIQPETNLETPLQDIIQIPQPSYLIQSPSGYTCSLNYQINTNIHINNICSLSSPSSSIFDSTSSNSLFTDNGYSFESHHYPFQTIVISLKFTGYVQSLSLGSQSNVQRYGLRMFNPSRNVDDTYYSSS
ncbi:unnamed protein product, partial [Adineta steineri]